jgi:death-on-curing protein
LVEYLTLQDVKDIHFAMMERYGEGEHAGVKSLELLESAVFRPQQILLERDAYPSLFGKAAVLFESIAT